MILDCFVDLEQPLREALVAKKSRVPLAPDQRALWMVNSSLGIRSAPLSLG